MPQPNLNTPENWDSASAGYAAKVAPRMMESFAGEMVERLAPEPGSEALEVAAGSGALTAHLAGSVRAQGWRP